MSAPAVARQPAGTATGGQFAVTTRAEPVVELETAGQADPLDDDVDFDDDTCSECGDDLSDNEGYDGLCGTCADAAEAEGRWGDPDDDS